MKVQRLSSDIISTLPEEIIESILTRIPIRDALRTSILSRRWRYCWMSMPKVTFNETTFEVSTNDTRKKKYKLVNAVFHVLLLHKGPILEFRLYAGELNMVSEFDQIILHLSRSNHVKKLIFEILDNHWKLPSLFFTLQGLEFLDIRNCVFDNVEISAKSLLHFLSNCPLLEVVSLIGYEKDFEGGNEFTFVDLVECLPLIATLEIREYHMKYFSAGGMPQKLPTSLVCLKRLYLDVCFTEQCVFSSALCIIRSSPNLEYIYFWICDDEKLHDQQTSMNLLDLQNDPSLSLDHLEEFQITRFCNSLFEIEFVKLILAKSPVLKKLIIKLSCYVSVHEEVTMLRDLIQAPLPRASPSAKLIVTRR